jgi:hypothetical protein
VVIAIIADARRENVRNSDAVMITVWALDEIHVHLLTKQQRASKLIAGIRITSVETRTAPHLYRDVD